MFGALFVILIFHRSAARDIRRASKRGWLFMAFSGIGVAWGLSFLFLALSRSPVVVVGPAMNISPLITLTLSHVFLQRIEKVTLSLIAGGLLIVAGAVGITLSAS
jgi:transporter family protein